MNDEKSVLEKKLITLHLEIDNLAAELMGHLLLATSYVHSVWTATSGDRTLIENPPVNKLDLKIAEGLRLLVNKKIERNRIVCALKEDE